MKQAAGLFSSLVLALVAGALWGASGCAAAGARPPPAASVALAGAPAVWRDWAGKGRWAICDAEPQFLLDELTLVNSALQRFLNATASTQPEDWPEARVQEVESEAPGLERLGDAHRKNLAALEACPFAGGAGFPFIRKRGAELLEGVKGRQAGLARVIDQARHARALAAWKAGLQEQKEAQRGACSPRPRSPQLFLAWRDEQGVTHWKFCDGSEVTAPSSGAMSFDPSLRSIARGQKKFDEKHYLAAAKAWPEAQVLVPPPRP